MDKCTKSTALPAETPDETYQYTAESIELLTGPEVVRKRPGMYVGDTDDGSGFLGCIMIVAEHAAACFEPGRWGTIEVILGPQGQVEVRDDGKGMSAELCSASGRSAAELLMTELHCGGPFSLGAYLPGKLHGVGVAATNALSTSMVMETRWGGHLFRQSYHEGVPLGPLVSVGFSLGTGSRYVFTPDPTIFGDVDLDRDMLAMSLRDMAMLCPGLTVSLSDASDGWSIVATYPEGARSRLDEMMAQADCAMRAPGSFVLTGFGEEEWQNWSVTVALGWCNSVRGKVYSFVLGRHTHQGGEHHRGLYRGLAAVLERFARRSGLSRDGEPEIEPEDVREGLGAIMVVTGFVELRSHFILHQSGTSVRSEEFGDEVARIVSSRLAPMLADYPELVETIVGIALANARRREAFGLER